VLTWGDGVNADVAGWVLAEGAGEGASSFPGIRASVGREEAEGAPGAIAGLLVGRGGVDVVVTGWVGKEVLVVPTGAGVAEGSASVAVGVATGGLPVGRAVGVGDAGTEGEGTGVADDSPGGLVGSRVYGGFVGSLVTRVPGTLEGVGVGMV